MRFAVNLKNRYLYKKINQMKTFNNIVLTILIISGLFIVGSNFHFETALTFFVTTAISFFIVRYINTIITKQNGVK